MRGPGLDILEPLQHSTRPRANLGVAARPLYLARLLLLERSTLPLLALLRLSFCIPSLATHRMGQSDKSSSDKADVVSVAPTVRDREEERLAALGYKQEFAREFTNLSVRRSSSLSEPCATSTDLLRPSSQTISFAFSIMGVASSVATTLDTPLLLGGPASVIWCALNFSRSRQSPS